MKIERKSIETAFLNGNLTHSNQMRNNGGAFFSIVFRLSFVNSERKNVSFFSAIFKTWTSQPPPLLPHEPNRETRGKQKKMPPTNLFVIIVMKTRDQMNTIFFSKEKIETEERMCMMHTHTHSHNGRKTKHWRWDWNVTKQKSAANKIKQRNKRNEMERKK